MAGQHKLTEAQLEAFVKAHENIVYMSLFDAKQQAFKLGFDTSSMTYGDIFDVVQASLNKELGLSDGQMVRVSTQHGKTIRVPKLLLEMEIERVNKICK